jgi:hypothetical protein
MKNYSIAIIALTQIAFLSCRTSGNQDSRAMDADKHDTMPFIRKDSIKTRLDKIPDESATRTGTGTGTLNAADTTGANSKGAATNRNNNNRRDTIRKGNPR